MTYKITQMLLTPNKWSRPQTKLKKVKGIVIHWVANTNSTAEANRNFFENRKKGKTNFGSAHFIIGLKGEVIQCLPKTELGYHVGSETYTEKALKELGDYPNDCTIGIECTHIDDDGKMSKETYDTLVELAVSLLKEYKLTEKNLWTHKEVVGWKNCHKWFVDNPKEWTKFKKLVGEKLKPTPVKDTTPTHIGVAKVQAEKLNIRLTASGESEIVGTLKEGQVCKVYAEQDGWLKIAQGKWISKKYVVYHIV